MEDKKLHLFWRKEDEISHEDHLFDVLLINVLGRASEGGDRFPGGARRRDPEVNGPAVPSARLKGMMEVTSRSYIVKEPARMMSGRRFLDLACVPEQPL